MDWLRDALVNALRWQIANPGAKSGYDDPRVPPAGLRVWGLFLALHAGRGGGFSGPMPIALSEIEAYARLSQEPMRPFEVEIVRAMDAAYLEAVAAKRDGDTGRSDAVVSARPLSPALFDALF